MKNLILFTLILVSTNVLSQNYIIKFAGLSSSGHIYRPNVISTEELTVEGGDNPQIVRFNISINNLGFEKSAISYSSKFTKAQKDILKEIYSSRYPSIYVNKIRVRDGNNILGVPSVEYFFTDEDTTKYLCAFNDIKSTGKLTYEKIEKNPYILMIDKEVGAVVKFDFTINIGGFCYTLRTDGNKLTDQMLKEIKSLSTGKRFILECINIKRADGVIITGNALIILKQ